MIDLRYKGIQLPDIGANGVQGMAEMRDRAFKRRIARDVRRSLEKFTFEENMMISFTPLVMQEVMWHYVLKVVDGAAEARWGDMKKLSRSLRELRKAYIIDCRRDLDQSHMDRLLSVKDDFISHCSRDFSLLWFTANTEIKRKHPDIPYIDIRTDALIALVVLEALNRHNDKMDMLVKARIGHCNKYVNPVNDAVKTGMTAFVGVTDINTGGHIDTATKVMMNNMRLIRYE